ncbi:transglutaminase domain-containing protein, partial [Agromyces seonyuensis]
RTAAARTAAEARAAAPVGVAEQAWAFGFVVVAVVLASFAAWPIYASPRFVVVAAAGTVLALLLAWLSAKLRWGVLATLGSALGVFLLAVVPLAVPSALASPARLLLGLRDGVLGVVLGWKQLVTLALPLGEYQAVLVPWFVVVFGGALVAALFAVRSRRFAWAAVPVAVAMVAFGLAFGASAPSAPIALAGLVIASPRELLLGALLALVCLVWLVGRARIRRAVSIRIASSRAGTVRRTGASAWMVLRRNLVALGLVVVAVAGSLAVAPAAAGLTERSALRDRVEPSIVVRSAPSPLSAYRASFADAAFGDTLFTVSGDLDEIGRVRIATLDAYDGETFTVGEDASAPGAFRRLPRAGSGSAAVELEIGEAYSGIWMPVPDGLDSAPGFSGPRADLLADGFFVDGSGASAIETAESDSGTGPIEGDGYTIRVDPDSDGALAGVDGGTATIDAETYPALVAWVEAQAQPRTGDGLAELVRRLRERGYLSHSLADDVAATPWIADLRADGPYAFKSSAAGHSRARIEQLFSDLTAQEERAGADADAAYLVSAAGDDEQFAVATALVARYLGFDSRVVLGVRVGESGDPALSSCTDVCTGGELAAWAEVDAGGDWVALDATPQHVLAPIDISEGEVLPEHATVPAELAPEIIAPEQVPSDDRRSEPTQVPEDEDSTLAAVLPVLRIVGLSATAVLCLVGPFVALLLAKSLRRRGRRAGTPEAAIVGAWEELLDRYADLGVPFDQSATRASAAAASGRPAAVALAAAVDHAVFSEHPPPVELADWAWQTVDAELEELRGARTLRARIGAALGLAGFRRSLRPDTPQIPLRKEPA